MELWSLIKEGWCVNKPLQHLLEIAFVEANVSRNEEVFNRISGISSPRKVLGLIV